MPKTWETYDYRIAEHYLYALTYGIDADDSMADSEKTEFIEWQTKAHADATAAGWTVGHWCDVEGSGEDWGRCDVSGLFAMRCTVQLHVYRESAE